MVGIFVQFFPFLHFLPMIRQTFPFFLSALLCCVFFFTGCGGDGGKRAKPKDLPRLFPCTLTFTQEGVPLEGASIILHSEDRWAVGGKTDEKGEASLVTNGHYDGAPAGTYKITVRKMITVQDAEGEVTKQTDVIPDQFKREAMTPLEIEIGKSDNNKTFDLGKAVSINVPIEKQD